MSAVIQVVAPLAAAIGPDGGGGGFLGGIIESVGHVVEDVGHVVEQVGHTVEATVQAVANDPLPTLLAVAGNAIGIPAPITMAAITAARGGDLEDIALSAGTAYVAPMAGNYLSSTFSSTLIEAGANEITSQVVSSAVSKGLVNGTIAEIKGGDFEQGFSGGFTGSIISSGVGVAADYVKPEIMEMAQENGIDLKTANQVLKDTSKAVSAGISAEVTGKNDFVTAFTNSAIGSTVDAGVRSLNNTVDEQFTTAAKKWDEQTPDAPPVFTEPVGAGIPPQLVSEVQVSDLGVDAQPMKESEDSPIANAYAGASFDFDERTGTYRSTGTDRPPESAENKFNDPNFEGQLLGPELRFDRNPTAEKASDFEGQLLGPELFSGQKQGEVPSDFEGQLLGPAFNAEEPAAKSAAEFAEVFGPTFNQSNAQNVLAENEPAPNAEEVSPVEAALAEQSPLAQASAQSPFAEASEFQPSRAEYLDQILAQIEAEQNPQDVVDVAEKPVAAEEDLQPKGGLAEMLQASIEAPSEALAVQESPVISEAPIAQDLLNPDPSQQPVGGLNAAAQTPEEKLAKAQGLKATDLTRPAFASFGNILKSTLMQGRKPQQRVAARRPTGALQTAKAKPAAPPKMDVSKLIPIQKATTAQARPRAAQTLDSSAKLSPVKNIAGLTSLLKKKEG
jgi:hypothetical protein